MWEVVFATDNNDRPLGKSRFDYYGKNQPRACAKLRQRLARVMDCLNNGLPPETALSFGWVHPEGGGIFAIDPVPGHPALRMYCTLKPDIQKIVIFTIGEKKRQTEDILEVREWSSNL